MHHPASPHQRGRFGHRDVVLIIGKNRTGPLGEGNSRGRALCPLVSMRARISILHHDNRYNEGVQMGNPLEVHMD